MDEDDIRVAVYLITGFLEGGKTSFLNKVLHQRYFQVPGETLVIACEEGVEEYDEEELKDYRTVVRFMDEKEDLTPEALEALEEEIQPVRVMIEYNPLWGVKEFRQMKLPDGWGIVQQVAVVDAGTYPVYRTNMKSLFVEMFAEADLVVFNRCSTDAPMAEFRRGIKVTNQACEVAFEDTEGQMVDLFEDSVPYDLDADVIEIDDMDYGIFYVDVRDHPERYDGRKIRFRGKVDKSRGMTGKQFAIGWNAMTCCADDIQFIGYLCTSPKARLLGRGSWIEITALCEIRHMMAYRGKGPVFNVLEMKPIAAPESDLVYFN